MRKYKTILTDDLKHCYLCGREATDMHHIFNGIRKRLSEKHGMMLPLCRCCHSQLHCDNKKLLEIKRMGQRKFEKEIGTREYFRHEFDKDYLWEVENDRNMATKIQR